MEGVERYLFGEQRYYKTWFEFWGREGGRKGRALGRGKLFNVVGRCVAGTGKWCGLGENEVLR